MTLGSLLSVEQIIPEMKATERWAAIVELIDLLVRKGRVRTSDRDSVLAALRQREETMSTGIGFGIAIPHASSNCVSEVVAAFGRSSTGIEFDSLDNERQLVQAGLQLCGSPRPRRPAVQRATLHQGTRFLERL